MSTLCTKESPWKEGMPTPVQHDAAHEVGDQIDGWPGGDIVRMHCDNCGTSWTMELPQ